MDCKFCSKECKNANSLRNHERLCKSNPEHQNVKSNFVDYHKKLKRGELQKVYTNQYVKAKLTGIPYVIKPFTRKKLSECSIGRVHTVKTKEKLSQIRSAFLETVGGGGFTSIKHYECANIAGEIFKIRGTWERDVALWLNAQQILWVRRVYLQYCTNGVRKTYTPDFFLPDHDIYIEVKGYYSDKDKQKLYSVVLENSVSLFLLQERHVNILHNTNDLYVLLDTQIIS